MVLNSICFGKVSASFDDAEKRGAVIVKEKEP